MLLGQQSPIGGNLAFYYTVTLTSRPFSISHILFLLLYFFFQDNTISPKPYDYTEKPMTFCKPPLYF
jgi:hypothetical protein